MSVAVYVMPLSTWLEGSFRVSWGPEGAGGRDAGPRRSPEEAARGVEALRDRLEGLLPLRPDWNDSGPARSATVFSLDGFSLPFDLAHRWAYRLRLPRLGTLDFPKFWLPVDFDPMFRLPAPWDEETEITVASAGSVATDLVHLIEAIRVEERPDLVSAGQVAARLHGIATSGVEHGTPVIIEG